MVWLSLIWFVFAVVFLCPGVLHMRMIGKGISSLQVKQEEWKGECEEADVRIAGVDIEEFVINFNKHIDYYNQTSRKQNKAQAIGYFVASATAIFSLALTLVC